MPYIITSSYVGEYKRLRIEDGFPCAVATIADVRDLCQPIVREPADSHIRSQLVSQVNCLSESGGTIGPFPDGYVINIKMLDWEDLRELAGLILRAGLTDQEILTAYAKFA
jgi:hypothetical protein